MPADIALAALAVAYYLAGVRHGESSADRRARALADASRELLRAETERVQETAARLGGVIRGEPLPDTRGRVVEIAELRRRREEFDRRTGVRR